MKDKIDILGIKTRIAWSEEDIHSFIRERVRTREKALLANLNIHAMSLSINLPWYRKFLSTAGLTYVDGDGVRWGLGILNQPVPPKIGTTRWIYDLAAFSEREKVRLYFLGSKPEDNEECCRLLKEKHPNLILKSHHGYFAKEGPENEAIIRDINEFQTDFLLVCFGMPLQEKWLLDNWDKLNVPVLTFGGAVLDYVAGKLGRVPGWMLRMHLEWLFRVCEEPGRLAGRYLYDIPTFFYHVFLEKVFRKKL